MRATIWIHLDNESTWEQVGKGKWVNDQLRLVKVTDKPVESSSKVEQVPVKDEVEDSTPPPSDYCIHGLKREECNRCE